MIIPDKTPESIQLALGTAWINIHGPPKELITDQEGGLAQSKETTEWLHTLGIKLHTRGKDQHARYIERRGALTRDVIHKIEEQLKSEGLEVPFHSILAEAVFCGSALLCINGCTPYNTVQIYYPASTTLRRQKASISHQKLTDIAIACERDAWQPWWKVQHEQDWEEQ